MCDFRFADSEEKLLHSIVRYIDGSPEQIDRFIDQWIYWTILKSTNGKITQFPFLLHKTKLNSHSGYSILFRSVGNFRISHIQFWLITKYSNYLFGFAWINWLIYWLLTNNFVHTSSVVEPLDHSGWFLHCNFHIFGIWTGLRNFSEKWINYLHTFSLSISRLHISSVYRQECSSLNCELISFDRTAFLWIVKTRRRLY